jgi:hypothetical protein
MTKFLCLLVILAVLGVAHLQVPGVNMPYPEFEGAKNGNGLGYIVRKAIEWSSCSKFDGLNGIDVACYFQGWTKSDEKCAKCANPEKWAYDFYRLGVYLGKCYCCQCN